MLGKDREDSDTWNKLFRSCVVEEVVLPSTLREMSLNIFRGCKCLRTVRIARGCPLRVRRFVGLFVRVRQK